ncbi:MAG: HD domain-containing protein [Bdellovibrionota bacterium]|mgnify:CR=1 FL=1
MSKHQFLKDLKEKDSVASSFLIKFSAVAVGKSGKPYMNLILTDKSGDLEARLWENVQQHMGQAVRGSYTWVEGRCQVYQGRRQVVIEKLQLLREDEVDPKDYEVEGSVNCEELYDKLLQYVSSMTDPFYKALSEATLRNDADVSLRLRKAPAAKSVHHAYKSGLLEHLVSVTALLDTVAKHYSRWIDRDLLLAGGFFHDIGKLWELSYDRVIDYTAEGRLVGHLVMGIGLIDRKIKELEEKPGALPGPFPEDKKLLIKHLVLAHHGLLEYGSPKRPKCLEAMILHMIDDLDSKVNSIAGFIEQDLTPGRWTALSRQYERFFYKPDWSHKQRDTKPVV